MAEGWVIHGGAPLGVQYGATALLEQLGFRFFHPWQTHIPARLAPLEAPRDVGKLFQPERSLRGLHLHTLHPIEPLFDFWVPGDEGFEGARRTIDWIVKNRGNYVQYPGLDQYQRNPAGIAAWQAHTRIVDYAHARGVKVGFGVQLFGSSNLQLAFDLLDTTNDMAQARTVIRDRLAVLLPGLGFDHISLSFGEFFSVGPDRFIAMVNLTVEVINELADGHDRPLLLFAFQSGVKAPECAISAAPRARHLACAWPAGEGRITSPGKGDESHLQAGSQAGVNGHIPFSLFSLSGESPLAQRMLAAFQHMNQ